MHQEPKLKVFVGDITQETASVKRFTLYPVEKDLLPPFAGGAHIITFIRDQDKVLVRRYSLAQDPAERRFYTIAIRRQEKSNGGSAFWHERIRIGDQLEISYPKNHFPLSFRARHHAFYAAGVGITPFIAMMADLKRKGKSFELHYAARSKEQCAFYDSILSLYPNQCYFYFSQGPNKKRLTPNIIREHPIGTHIYICGPETMIRQFSEAAFSFGYPKRSVHFELFTPPRHGPNRPFQVILKKSGRSLQIPEDQSLLETLLASGVKAPYSCRIGGCGSCLVEVLEGEVEHRDMFLNAEERKRNVILTCVSRAKSDKLVIDL